MRLGSRGGERPGRMTLEPRALWAGTPTCATVFLPDRAFTFSSREGRWAGVDQGRTSVGGAIFDKGYHGGHLGRGPPGSVSCSVRTRLGTLGASVLLCVGVPRAKTPGLSVWQRPGGRATALAPRPSQHCPPRVGSERRGVTGSVGLQPRKRRSTDRCRLSPPVSSQAF